MCEALGTDWNIIKSISRDPVLVKTRYLYFYLAHQKFPYKSLGDIGRVVGKDHSSVHSGIKKAETYETDSNPKYRDAFWKIRQMVSD